MLSALALHYGSAFEHLRFRLLDVPLSILGRYRLEDFDEHFEDLIECDREYDAIMLLCGEEPDWPWEDAEDRYLTAQGYVEAFQTGRCVRPVMLDFDCATKIGTAHVVDGHHRTHAAHEAGVAEILAYDVTSPIC